MHRYLLVYTPHNILYVSIHESVTKVGKRKQISKWQAIVRIESRPPMLDLPVICLKFRKYIEI